MDVTPWNFRLLAALFFGLLGLLSISGCGNRFDVATERGRQSRIDEANFYLSRGQCNAAIEAISHVYNSVHVNDEVRIIMSSAYACLGTFNMLTLLSNLDGATDYYAALAKSLKTTDNDATVGAMFIASDILTENGAKPTAGSRSKTINNYMVFVQLGIVGTILRRYGAPTSTGAQTTDLIYTTGGNPAGEMDNAHACALGAAVSTFSDSLTNSTITDAGTLAVNSRLNTLCVAAGLSSCAAINSNRGACDGTNADSTVAANIVTQLNTSWGN